MTQALYYTPDLQRKKETGKRKARIWNERAHTEEFHVLAVFHDSAIPSRHLALPCDRLVFDEHVNPCFRTHYVFIHLPPSFSSPLSLLPFILLSCTFALCITGKNASILKLSLNFHTCERWRKRSQIGKEKRQKKRGSNKKIRGFLNLNSIYVPIPFAFFNYRFNTIIPRGRLFWNFKSH